MNIRQLIGCLLFFGMVLIAHAQNNVCAVCGTPLQRYYTVEDQVDGVVKKVCPVCKDLPSRCFICGLPVKAGYKTLMDGRFICARDGKDIVESEDDARDICKGVKDDLDRLLSRFLTMPGDNVRLSIVDKFRLENLFHAPGYQNACVSVYGATASNPLPDGKFMHSIDILSSLRKPRLMAVCAHEYTHAWMGENVKAGRKHALDPDTLEAFCELVAYKYMESRHDESELANIKRNNYTKGQINVLIEADSKYGFNTVMEWIKEGEDAKITLADLDRVRALKDGPAIARHPVSAAALLYVPPAAPSQVPDTLMLKGISGAGQHRFALINNATLETMEKTKVRIGHTNVVVRCLEIRDHSVVIEVNDAKDKKELFLTAK